LDFSIRPGRGEMRIKRRLAKERVRASQVDESNSAERQKEKGKGEPVKDLTGGQRRIRCVDDKEGHGKKEDSSNCSGFARKKKVGSERDEGRPTQSRNTCQRGTATTQGKPLPLDAPHLGQRGRGREKGEEKR